MSNLTRFEQATLETLVSFKAKTKADIVRLLACEKLINQAISLCLKWDEQRIKLGLEPWNV